MENVANSPPENLLNEGYRCRQTRYEDDVKMDYYVKEGINGPGKDLVLMSRRMEDDNLLVIGLRLEARVNRPLSNPT
jgi:hypothetical protein